MTPQQFIAKWQRANLSERSAAQQHFLDLCELLGQEKPAAADPDGAWYTFERGVRKTTGGDGWADVWMRGHFAWEYKGKHRDLKAAYQQLLLYREDLENPPLLVVCDLDRFEIHTNFTGTVKEIHRFDLAALAEPANLEILRHLFTDPEALRPQQTRVGITEAAASAFSRIAESLRSRKKKPSDEQIAHFLLKLVFCMFAEKIRLLPENLFTDLLKKNRNDRERLSRQLAALFKAMSTGGDFGSDSILWFNGGLFKDADVLDLATEDLHNLIVVADADWSQVEPSIFGTLFERLLDVDKRAQIGAHYTSKDDILTLVEPVLMAPLRAEWRECRAEADRLWKAGKSKKKKHDDLLRAFVKRLASVRVLDPACGSGNFLYVAIQLLLDLEKEVIALAASRDFDLKPAVRPSQLYGIEINTYAHELATVVIWIGYLQWKQQNGFPVRRNPVLEQIETIQQKDAILDRSKPQKPREPSWPDADVIIGNPPFLGTKKLRAGLTDEYVEQLFALYGDRIPNFSDLCCYWFEKARDLIARNRVRRAGLLATQGIRGGENKTVLKRIQETGRIFFAISDRDWILDGANVHVSMVGFDNGAESQRVLDGVPVSVINPDLTRGANLTTATKLDQNEAVGFVGDVKSGKFDIPGNTARAWLSLPNPSKKSNRLVLRPWFNGLDVTRRPRDYWIIDFGSDMPLAEAAKFEVPFEYVRKHVKPERDQVKRKAYRDYWWLHAEPCETMRRAIAGLHRFAITPTLTKFRLFVWVSGDALPDHQLIAFAREDDYFFGILHSAVHERWSLRMGTALEDRPRYTPTTCFETFPFPPLAGGIAKDPPRDADFPAAPKKYDPKLARALRTRIAAAAKKLNELRENWLNPTSPPLSAETLKKRTLTNLYNDRPTWLELAHLELDRAVLAAYGWPEDWAEKLQPKRDDKGKVNPILGVADPAIEQEVLARLLKLNQDIARRK